MRKYFHFTTIVMLLLSGKIFAQEINPAQVALIIKRQVEKLHFNPLTNGDSLSERVLDRCIELLDDDRTIFLQSDILKLQAFRHSIDEDIRSQAWKFPRFLEELYITRVHSVDSLFSLVLSKPLNFRGHYSDKTSHTGFATDLTELRSRWENRMIYTIISRAYRRAGADSPAVKLPVYLAKEEKTLRDELKKELNKVTQIITDKDRFRKKLEQLYLHAISTAYDPHTVYLTPSQKENFQSDLSGMELSYGFEISGEEEGDVFISTIIPGGPAWRSGELHKKDVILQLQWKGQAPFDITTKNADETESLIFRSNINELAVKVRKPDGTTRTVTIIREKIEQEEEAVKGFILAGEKKIGYIALPDFYTQWEEDEGSGCANDVAREIILLKRENIEGLVLDLRFNGGGSLYEALQLAGIFINEGPLCGIRKRDGKVTFLKDPNRGTIYDGPLVVLINNQSASASELVAAALQDYSRAVIVGSPSYGKATMQNIFPADSSKGMEDRSANGYIKLTTGKLYRVNGQTAQMSGVTPDIQLPDAFDGLKLGERFEQYALAPDSIEKNKYYSSGTPLPIAALRETSRARVSGEKLFREISSLNGLNQSRERIPLDPVEFELWSAGNNASQSEGDHASVHSRFSVQNHNGSTQAVQLAAYYQEINVARLRSLASDIYIAEAYSITTDLIRQIKK
jgi:carboxyl-terminal processing protease